MEIRPPARKNLSLGFVNDPYRVSLQSSRNFNFRNRQVASILMGIQIARRMETGGGGQPGWQPKREEKIACGLFGNECQSDV